MADVADLRTCESCDHHRWGETGRNCMPCMNASGRLKWTARRPDPTLEDRALTLLAEIWDEPLMVLSDFPGGADQLELRLGHFSPRLSERVAELLEEAGR